MKIIITQSVSSCQARYGNARVINVIVNTIFSSLGKFNARKLVLYFGSSYLDTSRRQQKSVGNVYCGRARQYNSYSHCGSQVHSRAIRIWTKLSFGDRRREKRISLSFNPLARCGMGLTKETLVSVSSYSCLHNK